MKRILTLIIVLTAAFYVSAQGYLKIDMGYLFPQSDLDERNMGVSFGLGYLFELNKVVSVGPLAQGHYIIQGDEEDDYPIISFGMTLITD